MLWQIDKSNKQRTLTTPPLSHHSQYSYQSNYGCVALVCTWIIHTILTYLKMLTARRLPYVETPTFVLNSAMHYFQTPCILTGRVRSSGCTPIDGPWEVCRHDLNNCSAGQMEQMIAFEKDFITTFKAFAGNLSATH